MALLTAEMLEGARDGKSVEDVMSLGGQLLTTDDVMDGDLDDLMWAGLEWKAGKRVAEEAGDDD